mmetsp:Transcript_97437/g.260052  ORF Transcript_97437/g.260052 Transcript_97437/m.260052 type:complete len:654 (+) Transcript_97437:8-1969(+)
MGEPILFEGVQSEVGVEFWQRVQKNKLEHDRLDVSERKLWVEYSSSTSDKVGAAVRFSDRSFEGAPGCPCFHGPFWLVNTIEEFASFDKKGMVEKCLDAAWKAVASKAFLEDPALLRPVAMVAFVNMKTSVATYSLAFPALQPETPFTYSAGPVLVGTRFSTEQVVALSSQLQNSSLAGSGVFCVNCQDNALVAAPLANYTQGCMLAFDDPSCNVGNPGFPLRNVLLALRASGLCGDTVEVLAWRDSVLHRQQGGVASRSLIFTVNTTGAVATTEGWTPKPLLGFLKANPKSPVFQVDLKQFLDVKQIAADAVDLNIKLMKWRLMPGLDPEKIQSLRYLMVGSGTLGCSVARVLMGWGARKMSFLDCGKVSHSNPVRQSLFTHDDAVRSRHKAEAAAARVLEVMPDAEVSWSDCDIPMPGHPRSPDVIQREFSKLKDLVDSHDVVFLLTDSRESRWLPALLVAAAQHEDRTPPLGVTCALGFDSFVAMVQTYKSAESACYFCNDVTAPTDSLSNRSLDQQCTVTRPGLSGMAGSIAVELVAAMTQHPDGFEAARCAIDGSGSSILGAIPSQVRGYLGGYKLVPAEVDAFAQCPCCSKDVVRTFREEGVEFVQRVTANSSILERMSGLEEMKQRLQSADLAAFDMDDMDDFAAL